MTAGSLAAFLICFPLAWGLASFPKNMKWGKFRSNVILTCHTTFNGTVTWSYKPLDEDSWIPLEEKSGTTITIYNLETPNTGEYRCWDGKRMLDSTHVLLEEDNEKTTNYANSLRCTAQSYGCSFTCSWPLKNFYAAQLSHYRDGENMTSWAHPHSSGQEPFQFTLNLSSSPFAEESSPLVVIGEAMSTTHYLSVTQRFYLRDIVKPDPPESVQCERQGKILNVSVQPPASWSKPLSYFPLTHQFEFIYQNNGKTDFSESSEIPQGISKLRVRSRDPLVPSPWSQWTPWKHVTHRKKTKKGEINKDGLRGGNDIVICKRKSKRS